MPDTSPVSVSEPSHARGLRGRIRRAVDAVSTTEDSVYGTILVTALIAATDSSTYPPWNVLWLVLVTVLVFWVAHVYARMIAGHGMHGGYERGLRYALRASVRRTMGLLASTLIPVAILLLGVLDWIPGAWSITGALWSGVVILFLHGYTALLQRGNTAWWCLAGGVATASFGVVIIVLKTLLH